MRTISPTTMSDKTTTPVQYQVIGERSLSFQGERGSAVILHLRGACWEKTWSWVLALLPAPELVRAVLRPSAPCCNPSANPDPRRLPRSLAFRFLRRRTRDSRSRSVDDGSDRSAPCFAPAGLSPPAVQEPSNAE